MTVVWVMVFAGCINEIKRDALDFPDNPTEDYDGDGLTEQQGDCNDLDDDATAAPTWYLDSDGDGFGDANVSTEACEQPSDHVENSDDCDDSSATTYPGSSQDGAELCVRDLDGDGFGDASASDPFDAGTDCNDSDATIFPNNARYEDDELCVVDNDGDGYGDALPTVGADSGSDCDDANALVYPGYNEEAGTLCVLDSDGDGFGQMNAPQPYDSGTDCDDAVANVFPGADEACDGVDNDCSGEIDDYVGFDAPRWYYDDDNDGYGNADVSLYACTMPSGYVDDSTDCNDADASIYPNAPEVCTDGDADGDGADDAVDNNCNGVADENSAVDASIWYADGDADGFGNAAAAQPSCSRPSGYVSDATDCNDNNASIRPGAEEYCNGADDDCDGTVDEGAAVDAPFWYADLDGDGYGNPVLVDQTCSAFPGFVSSDTDCNDGDPAVNPGADELCATDYDDDCDGSINESDAVDPQLWYLDSDSDGFGDPQLLLYSCMPSSGYVADNTDCDDGDPAQNPGADEYCNSEDDNCDGLIDEPGSVDALPFYPDNDGDGYGLNFVATYACSAQPGTVADNTDCDDTTAQVRPGAAEFCNNRDDDCDGDTDEDATDAVLFYVDADNDGRGTTAQTLLACPDLNGVPTAPAGYSFYADDCDDADANRAPNLPELCTDNIDENCDDDVTLGAVDVVVSYADSDGDGQGNPLYTVAVCTVPFGYVDNALDCNDTDPEVLSGESQDWEICNGKLDRCENDVYGDARTPDDERDDDDDGFVECVLDVDPLLWEDPEASRPPGDLQGGDCEDDDANAFPGAPEICNGVVENFSGDGFCTEAVPVFETDDDGDNYVECVDFDPATWEGPQNIIGGSDCNDSSDVTYPGAAANNPGVCAQDADGDGDPDCNLTGVNPDYTCDFGLSSGMDFVRIPAGQDPLGRYDVSEDFFMMTTEVTEAMWSAVMGDGTVTSQLPEIRMYWDEAAEFANTLSAMHGREECFDCSSSPCVMAMDPFDCNGYRMPTRAEAEYATRSGTTASFWTGGGQSLGGEYDVHYCGSSDILILDGDTDPPLGNYVWHLCNSSSSRNPVAQLKANGFNLYDMQGNVREFAVDFTDGNDANFPTSPFDPFEDTGDRHWLYGGHYNDTSNLRHVYWDVNTLHYSSQDGFRLVRLQD